MPADLCTFEGNYCTVLREKQFHSLITQTFQRIEHAPRPFRIQYHVQIRHHKAHKYAYNRVIYKVHEKSYVLAIHSVEKAVACDSDRDQAAVSRDRPWLHRTTSELTRIRNQPPTYESIARKQCIVTKQETNADVPILLPEDSAAASPKSKGGPKRTLKVFNADRVVVREVGLAAAADLMQLTKAVATHISLVFRKQVSCLTLDFVKNTQGDYVLVDICSFEFSGYDKDSHRVMRLCNRVKKQLETFYRFRFDEKDGEEVDGVSGVVSDRPPEAEQHNVDIRTPQTVICRLCRCRINNFDTRYCLTSVMIQSTVMHMRSRLQPAAWPEFCKDRSYTMKSMQRADDQLSSKSRPRVDATEVNMYVCELCYNIYRQETRMIEVEHKLALFTHSHGDVAKESGGKHTTGELPRVPSSNTAELPPRRTSISFSSGPNSAALVLANSATSFVNSSRPQTPKSAGKSKAKSPASSSLVTYSAAESSTTNAGKESAIRDLFRAKNAPSRLPSGDYFKIHFAREKIGHKVATDPGAEHSTSDERSSEKKSRSKKPYNRPTYPQAAVMPVGRRVARSDMMTMDLTLCRMMVAIQKVSDLPVPFFDVYEDFFLTYFILGTRTDIPCKKSMSFARNRVNRFIYPDIHRAVAVNAILEGEEGSGDDSSTDSGDSKSTSSHGSSICSTSSTSSASASDETDELGDYATTRRASRMVMQAEDAASRLSGVVGRDVSGDTASASDLCVGALDAKFLKMSHFMVHGNALEDGLPSYNEFINSTSRIMVVLCGKIKNNAVVDERHWVLPDMANTKAAKAAKLRKRLSDLKADIVKKNTGSQGAYSHLSHISRGHRRTNLTAGLEYNPRHDIHKVTDTGDPLPEEAIAYAYLPLSQFKSNAVKRLDMGAPMTYAIRHLPRERSVPMLRVCPSPRIANIYV